PKCGQARGCHLRSCRQSSDQIYGPQNPGTDRTNRACGRCCGRARDCGLPSRACPGTAHRSCRHPCSTDREANAMIARLKGKLDVREPGRVLLETGGVGYEVFIPLSTFYRLPALGEVVTLDIRQVVREDAILLYGFAGYLEKSAFDLLMSVQHVGP